VEELVPLRGRVGAVHPLIQRYGDSRTGLAPTLVSDKYVLRVWWGWENGRRLSGML